MYKNLIEESKEIAKYIPESASARVYRLIAAVETLESKIGEHGKVPSPEQLCNFVTVNYSNYKGSYLCGKSSEILNFLLSMAGYNSNKIACEINGIGHLYVRCGDLVLDPSIKQFGDYPEISRITHPCISLNYIEHQSDEGFSNE